MTIKTRLVLSIATATLTVAGAMVSEQAVAGSRAQHHATESALVSKVDVLEAQLRAMQDEMAAIRAQGGGADASKVQELDAWMQESKAKPAKTPHDNMIFFRGGYARNDSQRNDLLTGNQFAGNALGGGKANDTGWYIGAGFDFGLTDDVWGMMPNTEVDAELMFEWKDLGAKGFKNAATSAALKAQPGGATNNNPACTLINLAANGGTGGAATGAAGTGNCDSVHVSQLSLTAAPKLKFMKGSKFRPWLIPIGLGLHVISPPSNGVTVLNPGMMFGTGAEYAIWKDIKIGADVRYHLTGRSVDGVNTDGLTAGGYLGIGF